MTPELTRSMTRDPTLVIRDAACFVSNRPLRDTPTPREIVAETSLNTIPFMVVFDGSSAPLEERPNVFTGLTVQSHLADHSSVSDSRAFLAASLMCARVESSAKSCGAIVRPRMVGEKGRRASDSGVINKVKKRAVRTDPWTTPMSVLKQDVSPKFVRM